MHNWVWGLVVIIQVLTGQHWKHQAKLEQVQMQLCILKNLKKLGVVH